MREIKGVDGKYHNIFYCYFRFNIFGRILEIIDGQWIMWSKEQNEI